MQCNESLVIPVEPKKSGRLLAKRQLDLNCSVISKQAVPLVGVRARLLGGSVSFFLCSSCKHSIVRMQRIKHFRLGIDSSRGGLEPIPRRDCEQRAGSWNGRIEKRERRWK